MKLCIISDLHLGDPESVLIAREPGTGKISFNENYLSRLCDSFYKKSECEGEEKRYLILVGDILDFAVGGYKEAYEVAKFFFTRLKKEDVFDEIIYVPGNHDFESVHLIEYEVNVINKLLKANTPVRHFKWSIPGIIDDRDGKGLFSLPNVTPKTGKKTRYGGLYLDYLTGDTEDTIKTFNFAYPNLYMATNEDSVLITHGHYFKEFWSFLGDLSLKIFKEDLGVGKEYQLRERIAVNFPSSQLSSSGTGQAGPLSDRLKYIQRVVKDKDEEGLKKIEFYLENLLRYIKKNVVKGILRFIFKIFKRSIKKKIMKKLREIKQDKYNEQWLKEGEKVRDNLIAFIKECDAEIRSIFPSDDWPLPKTMIFGHTHIPRGWGSKEQLTIPLNANRKLIAVNTGGWLYKKEPNKEKEFKGAEIFKYSTGKGFSSVSIR